MHLFNFLLVVIFFSNSVLCQIPKFEAALFRVNEKIYFLSNVKNIERDLFGFYCLSDGGILTEYLKSKKITFPIVEDGKITNKSKVNYVDVFKFYAVLDYLDSSKKNEILSLKVQKNILKKCNFNETEIYKIKSYLYLSQYLSGRFYNITELQFKGKMRDAIRRYPKRSKREIKQIVEKQLKSESLKNLDGFFKQVIEKVDGQLYYLQ